MESIVAEIGDALQFVRVEVYDGLQERRRDFAPKKPGDVGYDLRVWIDPAHQTWIDSLLSFALKRQVLIIWPFGSRSVASGLRLVMPNEVWCEIKARSSTMRRKMMVLGGTIDSGYRGEMLTILYNFGFLPKIIAQDERYSQVVFHWAVRPDIGFLTAAEMADVEIRERREGGRVASGFGSTGH